MEKFSKNERLTSAKMNRLVDEVNANTKNTENLNKTLYDEEVGDILVLEKKLKQTQETVDEMRLFKFPNATIMGDLNINHGQISGFGTENYLILPFAFNVAGKAFELNIAFTTGSDVTLPQNVIGSKFCLAAYIQNGKLTTRISTSGTTWEISKESSFAVESNKTYHIKLSYDRLQYKLQYSTDGNSYTQDWVDVNPNTPAEGLVYIGVGNNFNNPFKGIINLNKCGLFINNQHYWEGMDDAGLSTRLATDMSNIDDEGRNVINGIVNEGTTGQAIVGINRDFGRYVQRPDVTLTPVFTGKRFNSEGELVTDSNWNVGRFGAVERGLLYELYMGSEDKMVLGTALFVSHTVERVGSRDKDVYTPVFSAAGVSLPVSSYTVLWASEDYEDLLVSYRNDVDGASVMKVAEWGIFKSVATQFANLNARVDLKSFADGYYQGMRVGIADALANITGATIDYDERLTAGRMINNAPDLMTSNREPDATNGVSSITIKDVRGDVLGENNLAKTLNEAQWGITLVYDNNKHLYVLNGTSNTHWVSQLIWIDYKDKSHKHIAIARKVSGTCSNEAQNINTGYVSICTFNNTKLVGAAIFQRSDNTNYVGVIGASGMKFTNYELQIALLDLTTFFPTDQTFVNNLGQNDAIKVMHRLSFFNYEAPISNPTAIVQLEDETLAKGAEIIAKLGYQEPRLTFGSWGVINLLDGATGLVKQRVDMREQKKKAWKGVLAALEEQGCDVSLSFMQKPFECSYNDNVGIKWDKKGVTVSAWVVDLGENIKTSWNPNSFLLVGIVNIKSNANRDIKPNIICSAVDTDLWGRVDNPQENEVFITQLNKNVAIRDTSCASMDDYRVKYKGTLLLYELAEPIRIDFDDVQHIDLVNAQPDDLICLEDIDGEEMYKVDIENYVKEDGTNYRKTAIYPNPEWVEEHQQLPVSLNATLQNIGTSFNSAFLVNLANRVTELEHRNN